MTTSTRHWWPHSRRQVLALHSVGACHAIGRTARTIRKNPEVGRSEPNDVVGGAGDAQPERGAAGAGLDVDRAVVREHDLLNDVEPQTQPFGGGGGVPAAEGIENRG